ncbi:MAG: PorT family protein [Bacteroidales bacterium]|nr:PorT family protein [Bacteroidales bacterium]
MKKSLLLLALMLTLSTATFAIGIGPLGLNFGGKVGYQTATLSYNKADIKADFNNHWIGGIFIRGSIGKVYVQPELLMYQTSNIFDVNLTGTGSDQNIFGIPTGAEVGLTLNSLNLQVPLLVGFEFLDLSIVKLRAQIGPTANFVLKSKQVWGYSINGNGEETEFDPKEMLDTKDIAWGLQIGLGADIIKFLTLDVNYNIGFSKLFNKLDESETTLNNYFDFGKMDTSKQGLFTVTAGFKL